VRRLFDHPLSDLFQSPDGRVGVPADLLCSGSGVRPLIDNEAGNPAAVTRDDRLELDIVGPPLLTAWGGNITTVRKLA
jgi:glycerol-3-phosphate dehydrogenase